MDKTPTCLNIHEISRHFSLLTVHTCIDMGNYAQIMDFRGWGGYEGIMDCGTGLLENCCGQAIMPLTNFTC